jgi:hypothetical protein
LKGKELQTGEIRITIAANLPRRCRDACTSTPISNLTTPQHPMGNTIFSMAFLSDVDWLESVKGLCIWIYVAATAGVLLGVYWENDRFPKETQEYGWDVLVKSLATELFVGFIIFSIDGRIGTVQRNAIIDLQRTIAYRVIDKKAFVAALAGKPKARVEIQYVSKSNT